MKISTAFPSKYLKAADIPAGRDAHCVISDCRMEDMEQSKDEKPVLYFKGKDKGLVLNVTNGGTLADAYGDDTDAWHGKEVVIFGSTTQYQGRDCPCLRLRVPKAAAAPVVENDKRDAINDDDIPF